MKRNYVQGTVRDSDNVYRTNRKGYRVRSIPRFVIALILLVLSIITLFIVTGDDFQLVKDVMSAIAPTPSPTPEPTPTPTPTPSPPPTPTPVPSKKAIVVVDPGHGGYDPGTVSPFDNTFYEKEVTLDIGLRVKEKLEQLGVQVVMTRDTDTALHDFWKADVWERARISNEAEATFFVSIHVNGFDGKNASIYNGTEIYHQGYEYGEFSSKDFAQIMGEEVDAITDTKFNGVVKENFGVTRLSEMPAVLVETAYITNPDDHQRLKSDEFRESMAEGILNGTLRSLIKLGAYKEDGVYRILDDQRNSFLASVPPIPEYE